MIRVTKQADLGIVLMTTIAGRSSDGISSICSSRDLSRLTAQPLPMVSKVLKQLARHGLLESHRGVKGGYSLPRPPDQISVREIIAALDGPIAITDCIEEGPGDCRQEECCPVRSNFQRLNDVIKGALEEVKLAQMLSAVIGFPSDSEATSRLGRRPAPQAARSPTQDATQPSNRSDASAALAVKEGS
ncbi:MAG: SUF system Fe-S cluster assembly regulator [Planctomycetota bacterium]